MAMSVDIPSSFDFGIDVDLNADIDLDGKLDVTIPTEYGISINKLPPIKIEPLDFSLRVKEIPSIRAHLPVNYKVGFSLLGRELACIHLCGQGQAITEPYQPYPCEPQSLRKGFLTPVKDVQDVKAKTERG
jgi:hypothetical protein